MIPGSLCWLSPVTGGNVDWTCWLGSTTGAKSAAANGGSSSVMKTTATTTAINDRTRIAITIGYVT
jgi:hypothetical protein